MQTLERFKYEKRYWYPHLKPNDIAIWERFITASPDYFDDCEYDVPVGSTPSFDTTVNEDSGANIDVLYQRKIDVVGYKGGLPYIVELKPRAGASALGQLASYKVLYIKDYKPTTEPQPILITDTELPDMPMLSKQFGIKLIII